MRQRLTEGNVSAQLIKLTLPLVWGIFAIVAFNLADTYFVGQLGTQELAAMSFTFPVVSTFGSLAMGLGTGAASIIARAIGEGDQTRVKRFTTNSLTLALAIVGVFIVVGLLTIDPLFTALGATADVLPLVRDYMQIWYLGMIFLVVPMVGNSAIRAAGNTATPSIIMTVAAGINIALDPLFILGLGGLPRLELQGAAIATVIARALTFAASLIVLHFKEHLLCFQRPKLSEMLRCWLDILRIGLPAAMTSMITPISVGMITSLLAFYGDEAVAAFGVASRVESFALITLFALAASMGPFVGQNWGAKAYARVERSLKISFQFCLFWGMLMAVLLAATGRQLVSSFNGNPEVVAIAALYLLIVPITYAPAGIIQVSSATFNALGKPIPSVVMTAIRMFVLYIPLAYFGSHFFGIQGIFVATGLSNLLTGIGAYLWNQRTCNLRQTVPLESAL